MTRADHKSLLWQVGRAICRVVTSRYYDLKVYGTRHIPRSGGVLVVSNHQSFLDPVVLGAQLKRPMSYLARATLFDNRFFARLISNLNAFPVRRGEGDVGAVREVIRRLDEGNMLAMFPEGTRSLNGQIKPIEPGAALIIRRARAAVVPAVIDGSFQAWPRGSKLPHAHPICVLYGPPLALDGLRAGEIIALIDSTLCRMLADLRAGNIDKYK